MSRLYVYKVRYDDGTAPCVENGLLSLAICKPGIRSTAQVGDTLIGVAAKSMCADQRLVYAAVVTRKLADGAYYRDRAWRNRRDCVYAWRNEGFHLRRDAVIAINADEMTNDLGEPPAYKHAQVLLSDNYRYFAETRPADYRTEYPALARMIDQLGQGHRVHHGDRLRDEIERYLAHLWSTTRSARVNWPPKSPRARHKP
jgi:hypothetical protein